MANNNLLVKLESMKEFYSDSEIKIYDYILKNIEKIPNMTIAEFSSACKVSEATVIRFTRKIGYTGFSDFKIAVSSNMSNFMDQSEFITEMTVEDSPLTIFQKLSNFTAKSLEASLGSIDEAAFIEAIETIYHTNKQKGRIFLSGAGASSIIVNKLRVKLMRLNIEVVYYEDSHLQFEAMTSIEEGDLLIAFTTLGRSVQTIDHIKIAKENNATIILITQLGNQHLHDEVDIGLYISTVENNLRLASQTALIVQSLVVDTIFIALAIKDFENISDNVLKTKSLFDEYGYYR